MGCDIHLHAEVKVDDRWEYFGNHSFGRYYTVFAYMAQCGRNANIEPIVDNKGFPENANPLTRLYIGDHLDDLHSHTWLDKEEIANLCVVLRAHGKPYETTCKRCIERGDEEEEEDLTFYANSIEAIFIDINELERPAKLEYRLVFAFDN